MAVCFSVCLIVCVSPVYASSQDLPGSTGIVDASDTGLFQYSTAAYGGTWANFFEDGYPTTFTLGDDGSYLFNSSAKTTYGARVRADQYIEFVFSVAQSGTLVFDGTNYVYSYIKSGSTFKAEDIVTGGPLEILVDNTVVQTYSDNTTEFISGSYPISQRFSIRVSSGSDNLSLYTTSFTSSVSANLFIEIMLNGYVTSGGGSTDPSEPTDPTTPTTPSSPGSGGSTDLSGVIDEIQVVQGTLIDIDGKLEHIQESVTEIETTVKDTHDQLENPDSNIWKAAGSVISGAIESLFVPSEQDIANVKQGFDDLAQDKLGGAYTAMETVEDTIVQVNDKLNNPSAAEGVEFPGIAVPLGGEVGTVVLAERQMVTLPMELTAILHPLGGTIISIIAGLGTFNVLKDMVECFLSGFSYAEYLHRNKGGSDE